jgi:hypothetical protein
MMRARRWWVARAAFELAGPGSAWRAVAAGETDEAAALAGEPNQ